MNDKTKSHIQIFQAKAATNTADLARVDDTLASLRTEIRKTCLQYRQWRAPLLCGRAHNDPFKAYNMLLVKKLRGLWATYRFTYLVRADLLQLMADEADIRARAEDLQNVALFGYKPELVSYDELESRFGTSMAEELFDDMLIRTAREARQKRIVN